ncbi:myelin protein zero-like protein 2 isoform X2 [Epinephelus lanceolatus]
MFNTMHQMTLLFVLLGGFLLSGVRQVSGIQIYTAGEVEAVNGTDVELKCRFSSNYPVSLTSVSVAWYFQPLHPRPEEMIFYYHHKPYLPTEGHFRRRVVWSGDVMKKDASITLQQVSQTINGTYICKVLNLPDVYGRTGEVVLRVVDKAAGFNLYDWFASLVSK